MRAKLVLLVVSSVGLAVALVAGVSAWREGARDAALETERLRATAAVMSSLAAEATAEGDRGKAFAVLRSVTRMPGVRYARIERGDGRLLVETGGGARLVRDVALDTDTNPGLLQQLGSRSTQLHSPIVWQGRDVGRFVLLGHTDGVSDRFLSSLSTSLVAALLAMGAGLIVAFRLQRGITAPIRALTRAMRGVQQNHDYRRSVVDVSADGEIGDLVSGFNAMLGEVRARDEQIARHVEGLEDEVAARTSDLRRAKNTAEAANRAKSDFLATMSHEIRTPMNGIMAMAEMLVVGEMPARQRRFAQVIANSGASLLAIINDILDLSKIEAGKMELESVPVDVCEVVDDVCSLFWERAASKQLDLASFVDPDMPNRIAADPVRLRQIIGNLVNNAIKFTETGGVLVEVAPVGEYAYQISVRDTGIGIPEDKVAGVFDSFSQADQSTTRRFGGTGLGLSICRQLVEAMGGRLAVASRVGSGSTFAFRAPLTVIEPPRPWPAAGAVPKTFMVAHPGAFTRRTLARYLERAGHRGSESGGAPELVVAHPGALERRAGQDGQVICVGPYGDSRPSDLLQAGVVDAVLTQPVRRADLRDLLAQIEAGTPLSTPLAEPGIGTDAPLRLSSRAKVLVADDSAVNREVASEALARLGLRATLVSNGLEAVQAAKVEAFDLILMDGSMPELDGYDAAREIRAFDLAEGRRRTPIVALTAHVLGSAAQAWREADMDGVVHKPFSLGALFQEVRRFIEPETDVDAALEHEADPSPAAASTSLETDADLLDPGTTQHLAEMAGAGGGDFVARVRQLYRTNAPDCLVRLSDAVATGSSADAAAAAHALKSMSFSIGAQRVGQAAASLETAARDGQVPTPQEVRALGELLSRTLERLESSGSRTASAQPGEDSEVAQLLRDLDAAIASDQLSLVYQPQVDRSGETVVGVEALIRWTHPRRGPVSPAVFIPMAEEHGRISAVTDWVVRRALAETAPFKGLHVGFNASAIDFADPGFVDRVARVVAASGYDPSRLVVEITETAILKDEAQIRENMTRLKALGMKMALDDFGAGFSSLGHLRRYPFEKLKIDREFVMECSRDVQSATVVHAVVSLGRALGLQVIAEGVETELERNFLKAAGVHAMQGYLFGKGLDVEQLRRRLHASENGALKLTG